VALNDSGHVVGYSTTASGEQHAFLWSNGVMRDLGASIPGMSSATTVTNSDRVGITNVSGGPNSHVFVWQNGVLSDLGQVSGDAYGSTIIGMTATDVVAWAAGNEHYFSSIWRGNAKQDLGGLYAPLPSSSARAMNARGQVVGGSLVSGYAGSDINHPFVWENGVMRELAVLGPSPCPYEQRDCSAGEAVDINGSGTIVGWSGGVDLTPRAVLWRDDNPPIELGFRRAVAINDSGDVAGNGELSGPYWQEGGNGYFWHHGMVTNLGSLGRGGTHVADINDQGVIVGSSQGVGKRLHAFAWQHGQAGLIDLGTTLWGSAAIALNARGDIIGWTADCGNLAVDGTCEYYNMNRTRAVLWRAKSR
jgi:probable HAF family extracellular repeat protein